MAVTLCEIDRCSVRRCRSVISSNVISRWEEISPNFRFTGDRQYGDNSLPIVPEHFYRAELKWTTTLGVWIAPSVELSISDVWVDFANTFKALSFGVATLI